MAELPQSTEYPEFGFDGKLTIYGILRKYFTIHDELGHNVGLSRKWNPNTSAQYARDYMDRLLPIMAQLFGREKPMHTYSADDFETVLNHLRNTYHYAERTMSHYRFLLWSAYKIGFENSLYSDNIFWGELIDPEDDPEKYEQHRAKALTRIRKSFSVHEDICLMKWFSQLDPIAASGTDVALACMYFLGCRNNETCGADFSAFHLLDSHRETAVFDMLKTTSENSSRLKPSGKTKNAPRTLPVPPPLYNFILKRKTWLEQQVTAGNILLPEGVETVDQLPVACVENHYTKRAQTADLSRAGRVLFDSIGIQKSELAILQEIMFSQEFRETQIEEKDPTTYLFRRNVATRLYHLGFPWTSIQYWIAHEIEDPVIARNHFADEDTLHELSNQYLQHPVFHIFNREKMPAARGEQTSFCIAQDETFFVRVTAKEPNQPLYLDLDNDKGQLNIKMVEYLSTVSSAERVSILGVLQQAYKNEMNHI